MELPAKHKEAFQVPESNKKTRQMLEQKIDVEGRWRYDSSRTNRNGAGF